MQGNDTHVVCRLCGLERRRLGSHIKAHHHMTVAEYKARFPGALVEVPGSRARSAECRAKQSVAAKKRWSDPEKRKAQSARLKESAPWRGKRLSADHRAAISKGGTGVKHNITPEYRKQLGEKGRRVLAEIRQRPDHTKKLSEAQKRRVARGEKIGFQIPGVLEKCYQSRVRNGTLNPPGAGRGICGFRKGLGHYTRSTLEANFARVLVASGVKYEYEPRVFNLGDLGHYTPDFLLHAPLMLAGRVMISAGWVELKGWRHKDGRLPGKAQAKRDRLALQVEEPVVVLVGSDPVWCALRDHWKERVLWETQRRNLRTHPDLF